MNNKFTALLKWVLLPSSPTPTAEKIAAWGGQATCMARSGFVLLKIGVHFKLSLSLILLPSSFSCPHHLLNHHNPFWLSTYLFVNHHHHSVARQLLLPPPSLAPPPPKRWGESGHGEWIVLHWNGTDHKRGTLGARVFTVTLFQSENKSASNDSDLTKQLNISQINKLTHTHYQLTGLQNILCVNYRTGLCY